MERRLSKELAQYKGKEVMIRGWLNNIRSLGKINFIIVRDRKGFVQVVVIEKSEYAKIKDLQPGSVLKITGKVQETTQTDIGIELIDPKIEVEVPIKEVPPVEYTKPEIKADIETILDYRTISLRNRKIKAVFTIQAEIAYCYRKYMREVVDATEYFGPNIIGASSEGGSELFTVDYFDHKATLAQSSQLYKQVMVGVAERTFAIMPFFRAENSNTVRHLTEGKQCEFEMGFFESWHDVMDVLEGTIKSTVEHLNSHCAEELKTLEKEIVKAPKNVAFPRITFAEAQEIYFKRTGIDERKENDLSPAAEKDLCKYAREEFGTDCIFIIDWLTSKRPFYSYVNDENPELTNTFDLLCNGTEITSGGQRCHTYESLIAGLKRKGMDPEDFEDYLSIFKYGMPAHGGFGLGFERLTMTLLGLQNVREASLFPSDPKRIAGNRIKANVIFGAENLRNEIIRVLKANNMEYDFLKHEPTPTSQDSAKVRGTKMSEGIKAIILRGKNSKKNYQFNVSANMKLDLKKVKEIVGEACEFEDPEIIKKRYGIVIGGVPPFGNLMGIETYFDKEIAKEKRSAFNCGMQEESIVMKSADLTTLVNPKIADFAKE
ncbi:aspartate--tRNA(Asn) ligase [Candidatus Dojkabacteria bacterium]|nr:aspartate--tRNA(Asn) ligase [Candidatus Dojkabacteria bacterium]